MEYDIQDRIEKLLENLLKKADFFDAKIITVEDERLKNRYDGISQAYIDARNEVIFALDDIERIKNGEK